MYQVESLSSLVHENQRFEVTYGNDLYNPRQFIELAK